MDTKAMVSALLKLANASDRVGKYKAADALTDAAKHIVRLASETQKSVHFTVTRGERGLVGKVEVREKLPLADEFNQPVSTEPLEVFEFQAPNLDALKHAAKPTLDALKSKYGLEQVLENISI